MTNELLELNPGFTEINKQKTTDILRSQQQEKFYEDLLVLIDGLKPGFGFPRLTEIARYYNVPLSWVTNARNRLESLGHIEFDRGGYHKPFYAFSRISGPHSFIEPSSNLSVEKDGFDRVHTAQDYDVAVTDLAYQGAIDPVEQAGIVFGTSQIKSLVDSSFVEEFLDTVFETTE